MILEFMKIRKDVKTPQRANPSDAGLDVFFCPVDNEPVKMARGENKLFQTGLKFGVPHGYMLQVMNRSGVASKRNLVVGAHCIDSGYNGEIFIDLHNIGLGDVEIQVGDKIAQVVLIPIVHFRPLEKTSGDLYDNDISISNRGSDALGSTDVGKGYKELKEEVKEIFMKKDKKFNLKDWNPPGF